MSSAAPAGHPSMTPKTSLDERFSDPGAEAVAWSETQQVLEDAELFWVTTVRPDGRPHSTPLVAVWLDDALHFCTGETEQKAHNLAANPHVLLTTGDNGWQGGLDVVVEGPAVRVTDDELLGRLAAAWGRSGTGSGSSRPTTAPSTTATAAPRSSSGSSPRRCSRSARARSPTPATGSDQRGCQPRLTKPTSWGGNNRRATNRKTR